MIRHARLIVTLDSGLMIGGHATATGFLDAASARDETGRPVIPASALRGALREAFTRLARAATPQACCFPDACGSADCPVCRLFGAGGTDSLDAHGDVPGIDPGSFAALRVSDGNLPPDQSDYPPWAVRTGVGIDRVSRSAVPGVLYQREVLDGKDTRFEASLVADVDDETWELFRRSLSLVTGIGNGRSRGLGAISVELEELPAGKSPEHAVAASPTHGALVLTIELLEPMMLGDLPSSSGFSDTMTVLRGSAIRGAIAAAVASAGVDDAFQAAFVDPSTCLLFSDAWPCSSRGNELPAPIPRSSLACKNDDRRDHTHREGGCPEPVDGLASLAFQTALLASGGGVRAPKCVVCKDLLRTTKDGAWPRADSTRFVTTRVARDIATGSASPGLLYSMARISAGSPGKPTMFRGTVARVAGAGAECLQRLSGAEVRIGRGRNRGQGRVRLIFQEDNEVIGPAAVQRRVGRFDKEWKALLGIAQCAPGDCLVAVLARSDLAVPELATAPQFLAGALFGTQAQCLVAAQAAGLRSGWDDGKAAGSRAGPRALRPVVRAGSSWLFKVEGALPIDRLATAEVEGVGEDRELGCGQIVIDHRLFTVA